MSLNVEHETVQNTEETISSQYTHRCVSAAPSANNGITARIQDVNYQFQTTKKVGRVGLMMVGLGGNNGTTIMGGIIANREKMQWNTKKGVQKANMLGSMTQSSTMKVADSEEGEFYMKIKEVIPMVNPEDLIVSGWDINAMSMSDAMKRAQVFDIELQQKLEPYMKEIKPLKSLYYPDFIAANQEDRADNLLEGDDKWAHLEQIRKDIAVFKKENGLNSVIVLWTANTERFCVPVEGIHDTYENLVQGIKNNHPEISPSTIFALASLQEDCVFINGSPQNTFVKGLINSPYSSLLIGNDFKTGQTKFKTSFIDFLTSAGIKPKSCVSYNHLGNNDGKNLHSEKQFKSKETSKSECIKDLLDNSLLYDPRHPEQYPDHTVVIKYVPNAGDSKKAIDEYSSEIFMGGEHTFVSYNVCEDSLLAAGIIIDLIVLSELMTRISYRKNAEDWHKLEGVCSFLGYLTKAPESKGPIINSLPRQRACI